MKTERGELAAVDGLGEEDVELATARSNQAAIAIDKARLYARPADAIVTSRMSYRV